MQGGHRRTLRGWKAVDVPDCAVGRAGEEGDAAAREGPRPGGHGGAPRRRPRLRRLRLRRGRRSLRQDRRGGRRGVRRIRTTIRLGKWIKIVLSVTISFRRYFDPVTVSNTYVYENKTSLEGLTFCVEVLHATRCVIQCSPIYSKSNLG